MAKLRVSCGSFCRIEHKGRFLFLLNAARARKGIYAATPVAGAITYTDPAIIRHLNAELENPDTKDLRFYIDKAGAEQRLAMLRAWFHRGVGRELDPFREMREELVDEQRILPYLRRRDVQIRLLYTFENRQATDRPGARVSGTFYLHEVFDVKITNPTLMHHLTAGDHRHGAFWLTLDRAESGAPLYWQGKPVSVHLASLLRPRRAATVPHPALVTAPLGA